MVKCSFCGEKIPEGTGKLFITKAAKELWFCSTKCEKNSIKLKRKAIHLKWTKRERK